MDWPFRFFRSHRFADGRLRCRGSLPKVKMMGYVLDMRKYVGHKGMVIAYAVMIVLNERGEVLLETREDDGFLDFPGGSIEWNEEALEAAKRELKEETGLDAVDPVLFGVYSGPLTYHRYPNGDEVSGVDVFYLCRQTVGEEKLQKEEVTGLAYYPLDAIPGKLTPRNKKVIEDLKRMVC